ncbi:nucleotidyl transferase AbiEii/AbiGii toxin family protein [Candidatus Woesearchaeota archaeon]|nr:nucleotidyl transferase AbiEii/AbiGii toxin family protein [Candidatus Woesearchaeota archaeon]
MPDVNDLNEPKLINNMIDESELMQKSKVLGIPLSHVEKDYVMGWLLKGIYTDPFLKNKFILKGGNCLRKIYFSETRFSDDLDFTMVRPISVSKFEGALRRICSSLKDSVAIPFIDNKLKVEEIPGVEKGSLVFEGRTYFKGIAGDERVTFKIKFDISSYERMVFPHQSHQIIHNYSDSETCKANVVCYSLEEILSEKLRSIIQRSRPRDLFDIVKIVLMDKIPISKTNIARAFLEKTIFKNVPFGGKEELLVEEKLGIIKDHWGKTIVCPEIHIISSNNAINRYTEFVELIFNKEVLETLVPSEAFTRSYRVIRSSIREAIIEAGRERKLINLKYDGIIRVVEPYSFRYKNGEAFFGLDRTRGNQIKHFKLYKIQGVSIRPETYLPRWVVEF